MGVILTLIINKIIKYNSIFEKKNMIILKLLVFIIFRNEFCLLL